MQQSKLCLGEDKLSGEKGKIGERCHGGGSLRLDNCLDTGYEIEGRTRGDSKVGMNRIKFSFRPAAFEMPL